MGAISVIGFTCGTPATSRAVIYERLTWEYYCKYKKKREKMKEQR